jgi:hypothetical protein
VLVRHNGVVIWLFACRSELKGWLSLSGAAVRCSKLVFGDRTSGKRDSPRLGRRPCHCWAMPTCGMNMSGIRLLDCEVGMGLVPLCTLEEFLEVIQGLRTYLA